MESPIVTIDESEFFWTYQKTGEVYSSEELILSYLLLNEVLFCNQRNGTVVLFVLCNDLFAWGCADGEDLPLGQVPVVYRAFKKDGGKGVERWCCLQRKQRPQMPIEKRWREDGFWDEELEALPLNHQNDEVKALLIEAAHRYEKEQDKS